MLAVPSERRSILNKDVNFVCIPKAAVLKTLIYTIYIFGS
jgi:hypothetical protein